MSIKTKTAVLYNQSGSSLIGVAVLTIAMGFLMSGAIYLMQNYNTIKSDQQTVDTGISLQEGLKNFIAVNKRYPCPTMMNIAPDQPNFGLEDCSMSAVNGRGGEPVLVGAAPVRTLNVPDHMIVDGYGKRHIYAVTKNMTNRAPYNTTTNKKPDLRNGLGAITITDGKGNSVSKESGYVVYALISSGEDDRGAYNIQGKLLAACPASGNTHENCDNDANFISYSQKTFRGEADDFTHNVAFKSNSEGFEWHTTAWSACGTNISGNEWNNNPHPRAVCFSSFQERSVVCRDRQGTSHPDAKCNHTDKPDDDRACSIGPCRWNTSNWTACEGNL